MAFFWLLCLSVSAETILKDGETIIRDSQTMTGTEDLYSFTVGDSSTKDLVISLTAYSDYSDPDMYARAGGVPTIDNYDFSSLSWGSGSIIISPSQLTLKTDYKILVVCYTVCKYGITVSYSEKIKLTDGVPLTGTLASGKQGLYSFEPGKQESDTLTITLTQVTGKAAMYVVRDAEPASDKSELVEQTWDGNLEFKTHQIEGTKVFNVAVMALVDAEVTITAKSAKSEATLVQASVPVNGEVFTGDFNFYYVSIMTAADTVSISLTMLTGDGDLYVRVDNKPTLEIFDFSSVHMGNENLVITPADRKRIEKPTGKYYLGVFGYQHAVYTLSVTTSNSSSIKLQPGVPQSGSVGHLQFTYFYIDFPKENANITLTLTVSLGNPDLYSKLCKKKQHQCTFTDEELETLSNIFYSIHESGSESIEIPHDSSICGKSKCSYIIGVYGKAEYSTFTLTVSTNSSHEVVLQDGKPINFVITEGSERYFRFTTFNESISNVTFMLTPIYGDPDLYGSFNQPIEPFHAQKISTKLGTEIDQINWVKGIDSDSLRGTYHLMVFSIQACSFSILAISVIPGKNSTIQIFPGHPQKDTLYNYTDQDYRIYSFPIHYSADTKQAITISVSGMTGQFDLYAANSEQNLDWNKEIIYYNWKASNQNHSDPSSTIIIRPDDPYYEVDSTYLVLVMAEKFLPDRSATYVISYSVSNGSVILPQDVPYTGVVLENEYSYFMFPVRFNHEDITISVTALTGDPDLFISVNPNNTRPSAENYDFKSTSFGDEKISIPWENGLKEKCPNLPAEPKFGEKTECYLYLSVYGFQVSSFEIRVHPSKGDPTFLTLGNSMFGAFAKAEYAYYYTFIDASLDFKLSVQPELGDPDLFLNIFDRNASKNESEWQRPTKEKSDFSSQSTVMSEEIEVPSKDLLKKCPSRSCLILASVFCFSPNCSYLITATQKNEIQSIIENQPTYGVTTNKFVYYSYYLAKDYEDFLVTVTSIGGGNPDLYIRKGRRHLPNETYFHWSSTNWAGDSILITKDDKVFEARTMKGTYIIGVKDPYGTCSFMIIVNNNPKPIQKLVSGVPQTGNLTVQSVSYYTFANYIKDDINVALTPFSGSSKIYISTHNTWGSDVYADLPGPEHYLWSSDTSKDRYKFDISVNDKLFCAYCEYLIAVVTAEEPSSFSITAKNRMQFTVLQDGVPVRLESDEKRWSIMKFELDQRVDFNIAVTAYSGHPNIYVSKSKDLNSENFIRQAFYTEGVYNIKISRQDDGYFVGTYYIVVESNVKSSFSIVVNSADKPIKLIDGWPIFYSFDQDASQSVYFEFLPNTGNRVFCYLKTFAEYRPLIFTKFQSLGQYQKPSSSSHDSKFTEDSYQEIITETSTTAYQVSMSILHTAQSPQLNILVESTSKTVFQIYCSGSTKTTVLRLGSFHIEQLDKDTVTRRYEVILPSKGTLDAYVVPCNGEFKMEISSNWTVATQDNPDVVVNRLMDGLLIGSINNAVGSYFASVTAIKSLDSIQVFQFYTVFTPAKTVIPKMHKPGNNGLITWERKGDQQVVLYWKPVENDEGQIVNEKISYSAFFTTDKDANLVTGCGIHYFATRKQVEVLGSTTENSLKVNLPNSKGFINIIARLPNDSPSPLKEVVYDPMEVLISSSSTSRGLLYFWLLATLLFLAIVISIYLYRRYRAAEARLRYETSDIRNVASISASSELQDLRKKNPYERIPVTN